MVDKKSKRGEALTGEKRVIDLLERIGAALLYTNTTLGQNAVAKVLGVDVHRVNQLVKGIKKSK